MATKAAEIYRFAAVRRMNHLSAGGGNQDQRPLCIVASDELSRAVVHFEPIRRISAGFTGQKRVVEFPSHRQSRVSSRGWETPPASGCSGDRRRCSANDIYNDDRPSLPIAANTFR